MGYLALLFVGWGVVAGFLPPTQPVDGALKIGQLYRSDHTRIRAGRLIVMFAALVFIPFAAVVANLWMAIAIIPDQLLFFFNTGPSAWNGLFGFWLPIVWFSGFFLVNFIAIRAAILYDRQTGFPAEPALVAA